MRSRFPVRLSPSETSQTSVVSGDTWKQIKARLPRCKCCNALTICGLAVCDKCELATACVNRLIAEFGERGWGDCASHESRGDQ